MLEIVKKQSSAVRQIGTQNGARSPALIAHPQETANTATKTSAAQSGDFELAMVKQASSTISHSRQNSLFRGQNARFKQSPLMSMSKYPPHIMK